MFNNNRIAILTPCRHFKWKNGTYWTIPGKKHMNCEDFLRWCFQIQGIWARTLRRSIRREWRRRFRLRFQEQWRYILVRSWAGPTLEGKHVKVDEGLFGRELTSVAHEQITFHYSVWCVVDTEKMNFHVVPSTARYFTVEHRAGVRNNSGRCFSVQCRWYFALLGKTRAGGQPTGHVRAEKELYALLNP